MDRSKTEQVVLELHPGEPNSGSIRSSSGLADAFRGWLELASKLERLRGDRLVEAARPKTRLESPGGGRR